MNSLYKSILISLSLLFASCDTEYLDPYSVLEPDVVRSEENLTNLLNGVQQRLSMGREGVLYTTVSASGLNTGELRLLNPGNLGENELLLGGTFVAGNNEVLQNLWSQLMLSRKEASLIIDNVDGVITDPNRASTIKAYALFYRAYAHGKLIQYFERIPLSIQNNEVFNDRSAVLTSTIADLDQAAQLVGSGVNIGNALTSTFSLPDAIHILTARHHLMAGNYAEAIAAANRASKTQKCTWNYSSSFPNPLAFWFSSQNVHQAGNLRFGLPEDLAPSPQDQRIDFNAYILDPQDDNPNYQVRSFYRTIEDEVPIYVPGEIDLIQAEAHARLGNIDQAIAALDRVLTKTPDQDLYGMGAGLPAYSGAGTQEDILQEIYRNRRIELYLSGLSLEDTKRFDRPTTEYNREYYPYPNVEVDNNPGVPSNPAG